METVLEWDVESGVKTAVEVLELGTLFQEVLVAELEMAACEVLGSDVVELETAFVEVLESGTLFQEDPEAELETAGEILSRY